MNVFVRAGMLAALLLSPVHAEDGNAVSKDEPSFTDSLSYQTGEITIPVANARLQLSDNFRYLGHADTRRVLEEYWGNPPDESVLGMLIPTADDLDSEHSWAVVLTWSDDGYVSDEDAAEIDYAELLADMQAETNEHNAMLQEAGYPTIVLRGWAQSPHYDAVNKRLHWAKELMFEGNEQATVNYDIRVLGRGGYLSMNAIGDISDLDRINQGMTEVLTLAQFDEGHRYADFNPSTDKLAAYGVGALVAGGLASKAGLFAKLGILFAKFWKIGLIAVIAIIAVARRFAGGKAGGK